MFRDRSLYSDHVLVVILMIVFSLPGRVAWASTVEPANACVKTLMIEANGTHHGQLDTSAGMVFYLSLPVAGILSIEAAVDQVSEARPKLRSLGRSCNPFDVDRIGTTVEASDARALVALSEPGEYYFELITEDPWLSWASFQLTTSFAPAEVFVEEHHLDSVLNQSGVVIRQIDFYSLGVAKNEQEEVDPDPNKSYHRQPTLTLLTARVAVLDKNEQEEVDPDPNKSARLPTTKAQLALFPTRPAVILEKNEQEEVDPDPNKSARLDRQVLDGILAIGREAGGRSIALRSWVSFQLTGTAWSGAPEPVRLDSLFEWLADVLEAELARARLISPGFGDHRLRLLDVAPEAREQEQGQG